MRRARAIAVSLAGCDFGNSGVSVFAQSVVPRLTEYFAKSGVETILLGTRNERRAAGLDGAPGPILPSVLDKPAASTAFTMTSASFLARALGAGALYLPCANRRVAGVPAIPTVGTVHDLAQFHVDDKYSRLRMFYVRSVLTPLLAQLALVTTVSQATADDVERHAGVPRERIRVIPNGVTLGKVAPRPTHERTPYLLYPARLEHPGKNHLRLLEAFARSRAGKTHRLVFTGADWGAEEAIRATIAAFGLGDRVTIAGFVSRDELTSWMAGADAVIAAGLFEGFGLPAAEALALGRPVAASSTGSLPEVVGPFGVLFDPTDVGSMAAALDRVLEDDSVRHLCREKGPGHAARFSWEKTVTQIGDALQEVLNAAA